MKLLIYYLIIINLIGFFAMAADKGRAKKRLRRIPEAALMLLAAVGGSAGVFLGMQLCRHKTLHKKFSVGVPIILVLQAVAIYFLN